jgi:hypothetical protein
MYRIRSGSGGRREEGKGERCGEAGGVRVEKGGVSREEGGLLECISFCIFKNNLHSAVHGFEFMLEHYF